MTTMCRAAYASVSSFVRNVVGGNFAHPADDQPGPATAREQSQRSLTPTAAKVPRDRAGVRSRLEQRLLDDGAHACVAGAAVAIAIAVPAGRRRWPAFCHQHHLLALLSV